MYIIRDTHGHDRPLPFEINSLYKADTRTVTKPNLVDPYKLNELSYNIINSVLNPSWEIDRTITSTPAEMSTNQASEWQHVERPTTSFGSFPFRPALARAGIAPTCGTFSDYVMALVMGLIGSFLLLFCIFYICEADFE